MTQRMFLRDADPKAFKVMLGFEEYLAQCSLQKTHAHLIKIRVSQLNGCSYCLDKHIQEALQDGELGRRLFLLTCWRETPFFSEEEQAILMLAEEMTLLSPHGVSDLVYDKVLGLMGQQYTTEVMMAIIAMNAWNRVGITTNRRPA